MLGRILTLCLPTLSLATFVVPLPSGPYGVSIQNVLLTDHNQPDPYLNLPYRRVPISVISSTGSSAACEPVLQQYMPNITATFWEKIFFQVYGLPLTQTFTQTQLILCKPKPVASRTPVVIFGPAAGISRYFYNVLGSMISARTGWTVITYDIPGQTEIEEFPDGSIEYQAPGASQADLANSAAVGNDTRDALIVVDALFPSRHNITCDPPLDAMLQRTRQIGIMGHSQGGAAALAALVADPRLSSGIDLDGGLNSTAFSYLANTSSTKYTTTKPFAIFARGGETQYTDFSWPIVWAHVLRGTKWEFRLNDTQHVSYGDFPYLMDIYGVRQKPNVSTEAVNSVVGSLPGSTILEVIKDVATAFFSYSFGQVTARSVDEEASLFEPWGFEILNQTIRQYQ